MTSDVAERLRALTRARTEGRLTLAAYRQLRRPLLDGLVGISGEQSSVTTQPRAAAQQSGALGALGSSAASAVASSPVGSSTSAGPATRDASPTRVVAAAGAAAPARKGPVSKGVVVVVGGMVAAAAIFLFWRHGASERNRASSPASSPAPGGEARTAAAAEPIRQLLQPLLDSPDWSDARLLALNSALLEAGHARIAAAQDADWFNAFVEQVRSRVREQQALAGAPLTADTSPLAALATTLGMDLTSPDRPIHLASGSAEPSASGSTSPAQARAAGQPTAGRPHDLREDETHHSAVADGSSGSSNGSKGTTASSSAVPSMSPASPARGPAVHSAARVMPDLSATGDAGTTSLAPSSVAAAVSARAASGASRSRKYPACSAALDQVRLNYCQDLLASGGTGPLLAVIPPGAFMMGNTGAAQERPVHRVTLSHPFAMSVYEVSQSEYRLYCQSAGKACPAQPWTGSDLPVVEVSWRDANEYARWLSQSSGATYRLPTEAEWEYAARAGQTGLYPNGGDSLSQTDAYFTVTTTLTEPTPRSQRFNANAWRLMHMIGNVREWVADDWAQDFAAAPADGSALQGGNARIKVVRGGSYIDRAIKLRLTTREALPAETRDRLTGMRLVREIH
ncbi:MAG: formylglycine-generating enzyme family protein [Steroidobacteraceae bacterium]